MSAFPHTALDELAAGGIDSVALTEACLARIAAVDESVRAFVTVTPELALEQAAAADAARERGESLGPLHGLPVAVKDNIDTAGVRTTRGSALFLDNVPSADAPVAARLRAAGAVIVGKLTMHELAFGGTSQNEHTGPCRNPWDLTRVPGGSSGGSGAAVAAGEVPVSLGTDTGGSVRVPAALNGVVGLRPTYGLVPNRGIFPIGASFDTCGPLAFRALDVARALTVIAGYDPADGSSEDVPVADYAEGIDGGIEGVRIGVPRNFVWDEADPEVATAVRVAADELARLGANVEEIVIPGLERTHEVTSTMIRGDAYALHRERVARNPELFGAEVLRRLRTAEAITGADYAGAREEARAWRAQMRATLSALDAILCPSTCIAAPPAEGADMIETTRLMTQLTYWGSLAYLPSISIPCGFTSGGLPIGCQLNAAWWQEALLLRIAQAYQSVTDWHERRPELG